MSEQTSERPSSGTRLPSAVLIAMLLIAAAAAGYGSAIGLVRLHGDFRLFQLPQEMVDEVGGQMEISPELSAKLVAEERRLDYQNSAASMALIGAILGCAVGFCAGLARKSAAGAAVGVVAGAGLGAAFGAAGACAAVGIQPPALERLGEGQLLTIVLHCTEWVVLGCGLGLTFGLANRRRILPTAAAGMIGGLMAGLIGLISCGLLFPNDKSDLLIPEGFGNQAVWVGLAGFVIALMIERGSRKATF